MRLPGEDTGFPDRGGTGVPYLGGAGFLFWCGTGWLGGGIEEGLGITRDTGGGEAPK
jgi:hypothetical protein